MDVLPLNFGTLRLCGIWYEAHEKLNLPRSIYRAVVIVFVFYFTFTLTAGILLEHENVSDFTGALFLACTYITLCLKIINFVCRRGEMIGILDDLRHPHCRAVDQAEARILDEYATTARKMFIYLLVFITSDVCYFVILFVLKVLNGIMELPYNSYQFYDVSTKEVLFSTAVFQVVCVLYSIAINISFDTLTAGLLILMSGQLELNAHRLSKLGENNIQSISDCIAHNVLINTTVEKVESFIIGVMIPFFFFSLLSICASIFQLSEVSLASLEFFGFAVFAVGILLQVLVYCWFGNELMLKSETVTNAMYNCDWIMLSPQDRKSLRTMMLCNMQGRTVSYSGQCSLTLDTFVWILKTSYATVSLLHQMNTK